jgi:hypothetical protein
MNDAEIRRPPQAIRSIVSDTEVMFETLNFTVPDPVPLRLSFERAPA